MTISTKLWASALAMALLSGCATKPDPIPEPEPEPEIVVVLPTCYPVAALTKVIVPAVVKTGFSIVSIETPSDYVYDPDTGKTMEITHPPIERREQWTKVVTPETHYYTSAEGETVTDICELNDTSPPVILSSDPI